MKKSKAKNRKRAAAVAGAAICSAHVDRLYKAVANYVKKGGGKLIIVGGVEIQEWPGEGEHKFRVAIRCLGRKPSFVAPNESSSPAADKLLQEYFRLTGKHLCKSRARKVSDAELKKVAAKCYPEYVNPLAG